METASSTLTRMTSPGSSAGEPSGQLVPVVTRATISIIRNHLPPAGFPEMTVSIPVGIRPGHNQRSVSALTFEKNCRIARRVNLGLSDRSEFVRGIHGFVECWIAIRDDGH